MDGVGGTVKNMVFRSVKSGRAVINSPKEFAEHANEVVPSISSLYLPVKEMMDEPEEISNAPSIAGTLKIHKVERKYNENGMCHLEFFHFRSSCSFLYTVLSKK